MAKGVSIKAVLAADGDGKKGLQGQVGYRKVKK